MKRTISFLAIAVLMVSMMSMTAFAFGGRCQGGGMRQQLQCEACTVDGCDSVGPHQHDDAWYCNQVCLQGDYEVCTVEGCTQTGLHEHDGTYYYCANRGTGLGCGGGGCWR